MGVGALEGSAVTGVSVGVCTVLGPVLGVGEGLGLETEAKVGAWVGVGVLQPNSETATKQAAPMETIRRTLASTQPLPSQGEVIEETALALTVSVNRLL